MLRASGDCSRGGEKSEGGEPSRRDEIVEAAGRGPSGKSGGERERGKGTHGRVPLGDPALGRRLLVHVPLGEEGAPLGDERHLTRDEERPPARDDGHDAEEVAPVALGAAVLGPLRATRARRRSSSVRVRGKGGSESEQGRALGTHLEAPVDGAHEREDDGAVLDLEELGVLEEGVGRRGVVSCIGCERGGRA